MCVPVDAELPDLGLISPLPSGAPVTLTTTDGSPFRAFATRAAEPSSTGFVVLPDIRGLIPFYERLADALASVGFDSVAIDFYGRHEGLELRDPDWDPWPTLDQMNYEQNLDDCGVAVEYLRSLGVGKVLTLGFCMGGALALHEGYSTHGLAGTVCAYGSPVAWADYWPSAFDHVQDFDCPVLGLFGGADHAIDVNDVRAFDAALTDAGRSHTFTIYDGAPHSFFDRNYAEWAEASRDAWDRIVAFGRAC